MNIFLVMGAMEFPLSFECSIPQAEDEKGTETVEVTTADLKEFKLIQCRLF